MGEQFSRQMEVTMGVNRPAPMQGRLRLDVLMTIAPEYRTRDENIRVLEHELMIAGHEFDCEICIENGRSLHEKAIRAMKRAWDDRRR